MAFQFPIKPPYPQPQATRMMENVRGKILGVGLLTAQAELFSTERDFCDFTNAWQEDIEVPIQRGVLTYKIEPASIVPTPPPGFDGGVLINGSIIRLMNLYNSTDTEKKLVAVASMPVPGFLTLRRAPSEDALWVATVAKVPTDPTDPQDMPVIAPWIMEKYYNAFENGVMGRLHLSVGKPYYSKEAGVFHWKMYNKARSEARVEVLHANNWGAQAWLFPQSMGVTRPQRGV